MVKKKRFYFQAGPSSCAERAVWKDDDPCSCVAVSEAKLSMSLGDALAWLSSGPDELIGGVSIVEKHGAKTAVVTFQEACCPHCGNSDRHILTVGELSKRNPPDLAEEQTRLVVRAAQELIQEHLPLDGAADHSWHAAAPSHMLITCPRCGRDYAALRPQKPAEEDPSSIRFLDVYSGSSGVVGLEVEGEEKTYRVEINANTGYTTVERTTLYKGLAPYPPDSRKEFGYPEVFDLLHDAFLAKSIYDYVQQLLPAAARGVEWSGRGLDWFQQTVAGNRFRGYPAGFYRNVKAPRLCYSHGRGGGINRLPVAYDIRAMEGLYAMTPLPSQKKLRKTVFENPYKLRTLLDYSNVPFSDPNILQALVSDARCDEYLSALSPIYGEVSDVWFFLAGVFGDKKTFGFLKRVADDEDLKDELEMLSKVSIDARNFDPATIDLLGRLRIADVCKNAPALALMSEDEKGDLCERIRYSDRQRRLESTVGNLVFKLPEEPIRLVAAGQEMKNCLGGYIDKVGDGQQAVVLVFDASRKGKGVFEALGLSEKAPGKLIAAVCVDEACEEVVEAHVPCNGPIPEEGLLAEAYRTWMADRGLTKRSSSYGELYEPEPMF